MTHPHLPLQWYVDKLHRGEPFTSLLYGDGEFTAMSGAVTGRHYTNYRELVSQRLVDELRASLTEPGDDIIRGTDLFLAYPETYKGTDIEAVTAVNRKMKALMSREQIARLVDGTVWDVAARGGQLGPLLTALRGRQLAQVSHYKLFVEFKALRPWFTLATEERDAASHLDYLERNLTQQEWDCCVVCMGLGAIPLIMRLRKHRPQATFLDLGSTFDVFVGLGAERGWRRELYANPAAWQEVVRKNLEGVE